MKRRDSHDPFRRLIRVALHERNLMLLAGVSLASLALTQLYLTWLLKEWAEAAVLTGNAMKTNALLPRALITSLIALFSLFLSRYALASAGQRLLERLRNQSSEALLAAPVSVVSGATSGQWLSRVFNDINVLSGFLVIVARRLVTEVVLLTGAIILMFVLSWRMALCMVIIVPIAGVLFTWMGRGIRRRGTNTQAASATLTSTINEQLRGLTTLKGFQAEPLATERIRREAGIIRDHAIGAEVWAALLISVVFVITGAAFLSILVYGSLQLPLTGGEQATFLAFCLYAGQTVEPARRLAEVQGLLQQSMAAATRVFEVIDLAPEKDQGTASAPEDCGVRMEEVWFAYPGNDAILRGVSFSVHAGELVGLCGPSGCGKTTIGRFLLRYEEPQSGRIEIGRVSSQELKLQQLRSSVCVVEQEPFLFSGPLIDNLRLGNPSASRMEIDEAIRMTSLETLVASLPRGLDSAISEAGRDLSGGERQRIALARAVLRNPRLLVLDEATSAIDSETELAIFNAMSHWLKERTVIVVSHRLSTVSRLPRIVLLDGGRIVADDHPLSLATHSSAFRTLFADQLDRGVTVVPA